jgi:DNA helicase IV
MLNTIKSNWQKFTQKNVYLTSDLEKGFMLAINKLSSSKHIPHKLSIISQLKNEIATHNISFVNNCIAAYINLLNGKDDNLKHPLDQEQKIAVIRDNKHNLIIAGAGSGKTSVITTRIAYLVRKKDSVPKEKILALAFTQVAAQEMQERLEKLYKIQINISTFHKLGLDIITSHTQKRPKLAFSDNNNENQYKSLTTYLFNQCINKDKSQKLFIKYLKYSSQEKIVNQHSKKQHHTITGQVVKSKLEKNISDFLSIYNIKHQYEPCHSYLETPLFKKILQPTFYLPKYNLYIKIWQTHWTRSLKILTKKEHNYQKYIISKNKQKFLEIDPEKNSYIILRKLVKKLHQISYTKIRKPDFELFINSNPHITNQIRTLQDLIPNAISTAKSNFIKPNNLTHILKTSNSKKTQIIFGKILLEVYIEYEAYLKTNNAIDFNDMINLSIDIIKQNPIKYKNIYKHILVDEFQDISKQRLELIKAFVNKKTNTKLFCVGDDWQSIYQFTGSEVDYFVNFDNYFHSPSITYLYKNYRCSDTIVEMSNSLINNNKNQIKKNVKATNNTKRKINLYEIKSQKEYKNKQIQAALQIIHDLLNTNTPEKEIMVISRFNKSVNELKETCIKKKINIEHIRFYSVHKSKGSEAKHVLILDVTSGLYGFPCEIKDSGLLDIVKNKTDDSYLEEERRLFYVALTRSKEFLYIFTQKNKNSLFLKEIKKHTKICR